MNNKNKLYFISDFCWLLSDICPSKPGMEQTFSEYKEWEPTVEPHVKEAYERARKKMKDLQQYEKALVCQ